VSIRRRLDGAGQGAEVPALPVPERECDEGHCVTCSDEGVPMRVLEAKGDVVLCEGGVEVMTDLVGPVEQGDELLVHAGVALVKL
jgi:HupF/HypC family protein